MSDYQLYCGDCLDVLPTLADGCADAIITDLPYGTTACKWDEVIPFAPMWEQVKRLLKKRGAFVTTASQPFTSALVMSNADWFKYELVWNKSRRFGVLHAKNMPLKKHENIIVFSGGAVAHKEKNENRMTYNPQMETGKPYKKLVTRKQFESTDHRLSRSSLNDMLIINDGYRYPHTVLDFDFGNQNSEHPSQKPVALYEYLVRTYTNECNTVLDFAMGSGTTGIACVQTGRNFIGIEKETKYFEIAQRRIAEAQPRLAELV